MLNSTLKVEALAIELHQNSEKIFKTIGFGSALIAGSNS